MGLGVVWKIYIYINFVKDFHNKPQINTTNININTSRERERKRESRKEGNKYEKKKQQAVAGP